MGSTATDVFAATLKTFAVVTRTETQFATITESIQASNTYTFVDGGANAAGADFVWSDTRSLTGGTTETIDLLAVADQALGATGIKTFRTVRAVQVRNLATITGPRIVVGPAAADGWGRVRGDVGPGGELLGVQSVNHWPVWSNERNVLVHATGATGATGAISYSIVVIGSSVTGATGY